MGEFVLSILTEGAVARLGLAASGYNKSVLLATAFRAQMHGCIVGSLYPSFLIHNPNDMITTMAWE